MPTSQTSQCSDTQTVLVSTPKTIKSEEKKSKTFLNILPRLPSSDSLTNSPGPASPGKLRLLCLLILVRSVFFSFVTEKQDCMASDKVCF